MSTSRPAAAVAARLLTAVLGLSWVCAPSARAATVTWWATGSSGAAGGTGTWNTSDFRWTADGLTWSAWNNTNIDTAVFGGVTAGTVTLNSAITVGGLTFTTTGYTLTGNTLTLAGGTAAIDLGSGISGTITSLFSGTAVFQKTGSGTLTLNNSTGNGSALSGGIDVSGGTLKFAGASVAFNTGYFTGSTPITVRSGGTLEIAGNWNTASSNVITIDGGTLNMSNGTTSDSTNYVNDLTLRNGATVTGNAIRFGYHADAYVRVTGSIASTSSAGMHLLNNPGLAETGFLDVGDVTSSTATDYTISGAIVDNSQFPGLPLVKIGAGTLVLSGNSSFSGPLSVRQGTLSIATINNASANGTLGNSANAVTLGTSGSTGTLSYTGATASSSKRFTLATGGTGAFDLQTSGTLTLSGVIDGSGGLVKSGSGALLLSASNAYAGNTIVNAGTLRIGNLGALGPFQAGRPVTQVIVNAGGAVDFNGVIDATYGYTIAGSGVGGTGALLNTGAAIGNGNSQASNITLAADATIGGSANWALLTNGVAATTLNLGGFTLTKTGANTITLANTTITNTGTISIVQGTLAQTSVGASGTGATVVLAAGAALDLGSLPLTIGGLSGGGGLVALGTGTLTFGGLNASTTYSGAFTGSGGLVKAGTGTTTLNTASSQTAPTVIQSGGITLAAGSALGSGAVTLTNASSGTNPVTLLLNINNTANNNLVVDAYGTGTVTIGSSFTATTSQNTQFGGTLTLSSRDVTLQAGTGDRTTFAGQITGTGNVTIATINAVTNNRVTFDRTSGSPNNFVGNVTLTTNATLQLGVANSIGDRTLPDSANVIFNAGSRLRLAPTGSGDFETMGALVSSPATSGSVDMFTGTAFTLLVGGGNASGAYGGTIINSSGALAITKVGSGTQSLSGASSYTGSTTVRAGTLVAGANAPSAVNGAFGNSSGAIILGDGSTGATDAPALLVGGAFTVGRAVTVGSVVNTSAYTAVLGGTNASGTATFSGNVTLNTTASAYTGLVLQAAPGGTVNFTGTWTTNDKPVTVGSAGNTGTVRLASAMATTGGVLVNAGTLLLGTASALGSTTPVTMGGGTLDIGGLSAGIGTLSGSGPITGTTGAVLTVTQSANATYAGIVSGAAALTKAGAATLTLGGVNTYAGATAINSGTLAVAAGGSIVSSAVTVANAATLAGSGTSGATTILNGGILAPGSGGVGTLTLSALTFGTAVGNTATVSIPTTGSSSIPATLQVNGDVVTNGGAGSVTFAFGSLSLVPTGTYSLIAYTGSLASGTTPFAYTGSLSGRQQVNFDNPTGVLNLVISNAYPIWTGSNGPGWFTTDNWKLNTDNAPTTFQANDTVVFTDGAATGAVTISGSDVNPVTTTFNGDTLAYTLDADGAYGLATGNLIKSGSATVTIANTNAFSGGTVISGGSVVLTGSGGLGSGNVTVSGGSLVLTNAGGLGSGAITVSNARLAVTGSGQLGANAVSLASGTIEVGGNNALGSGTVTLSGGVLASDSASSRSLANRIVVGGGVTLGSAVNTGALVLSGTLDLGVATRTLTMPSNVTLSGAVVNGGLVKAGGGTLTVTGSNAYSGGTTLSAGALRAGNDAAFGIGGLTLSSGTLSSDSAAARSLANVVMIAGNVVLGDPTATGPITLSGSVGLGGGTRQVFTAANVTISGVVFGGGLTKAGLGTLTLSASNSYAAGTTLSAGTLRVGNNSALGAGTIALNGGMLSSDSSTARSLTNALTVGGSVTLGDAVNSGTLAFSGAMNLGGATRQLTIASSVTLSGIISSGGLSKSGTGTLVISGANTYSGGTTVSVGILRLGSDSALPSNTAVTVATGATFDYGGFPTFNNGRNFSFTISGSGVDGLGAITNSSATELLSYASIGSLVLAADAAIGGNGGRFDVGTGNAGTTVNGGGFTLTKVGTDYIVFRPETVTNLAAVRIAGGQLSYEGYNRTTAATASMVTTILTGGTLVSYGNITLNTPLVFEGGVLSNMYLSPTWTGAVTINSATATVVTNSSTPITLSGSIGGVGGLLKTGVDTLTLSGSNSYAGDTTVSAGTLKLGNTSALPSGAGRGNLSLDGTLDLNGVRATVNGLTGAGTVRSGVVGAAALTVGTNDATSTFTGVIQNGSGTVSLVKTGAGTLTLGGLNTYTGSTAIQSGTLALGLNNAIPGASAITLGSAGSMATLNLDNHALAISSLTFAGQGGTLPDSGGSVTLQNLATGTARISVLSGTANEFHPNVTLSSTTVIDVASNASLLLHATLSGSAPLTKSGLGLLQIFGNNEAYLGAISLTGGTTQLLGGNASLGSGTTTVFTGATLDFNNRPFVGSYVLAGGTAINLTSGSTTVLITGTSTISGTSTAADFLVTSTGSAAFDLALTGSTAVTIDLGGRATFNRSVAGLVDAHGTSTFAGSILAGANIQVGEVGQSGALATFAGDVAHSSNVTVNGGALATFTGTAAGSIATSGTVDLSGRVTSTGGLTINAGGVGRILDGAVYDAADIENAGSLVVDRTTDLTIAAAIDGTGSLTKQGASTLTLSGSSGYSGGTTLSAGAIALSGAGTLGGQGPVSLAAGTTLDIAGANGSRTIGTLTGEGAVTLGGNTLRTVVASGNDTFAGVISGSGGFTKAGVDQLALAALQAFTGPATVEEGNLLLASGTGLASASRIDVASGASIETYEGETLVILGSQSLGGYGTVIGPVSFASGAILSPGGSVGTLTNDGSTAWNAGFTYLFEMNNASGTAGLSAGGWDLYNVTGTLTLAAGLEFENQIVVDLTSLSGSSAGLAAGFDENSGYAWLIADAGAEITTFNPTWFRVNTTNFQNLSDSPERFSVVRGDSVFGSGKNTNQLYLVYAAVPEPSTLVLAGIGLAAAGWAARRRRARRPLTRTGSSSRGVFRPRRVPASPAGP